MANARKIAVKALMKMDSDDAYSNIVINNALNNSELTGVASPKMAASGSSM